MDSLAAGAILALVIRGPNGIQALGRIPKVLAICSALLLGAIYLWNKRLSITDPIVATIGFTLIAICFAACLAITVASPPHSWIRRVLSSSALVALGTYSYGIYVIHAPVIWFLSKAGLQADIFPRILGSTLPGVVIFSVIGISISIGLAMLSYHYWEWPFLRLKRYLPYNRTKETKQANTGAESKKAILGNTVNTDVDRG
jgi:peptidoglycan/LPS O-acetylase OafA/YrhL